MMTGPMIVPSTSRWTFRVLSTGYWNVRFITLDFRSLPRRWVYRGGVLSQVREPPRQYVRSDTVGVR